MAEDLENNSVAQDVRSNEELDSLADQTDVARNSERPMSTLPDKTSGPDKTPKEDYEFVHNGKTIKATREQLIKWAQMGYDRPQFAQKWNQEKAKWEQERNQWLQNQQKWAPYQQIDEWAKQNPSQWQQLEQLWKQSQQNPNALTQQGNVSQNSGQIGQEFQPYLSKIQNLEQKLSQFEPIVNSILERDQMAKQSEEDQKLDQEVRSIREQYKDLDWDNLDENGKSLEFRILEHAQNNGISKFGAAFKDLLHDELLQRAQAQAKINTAKGIQNRTKLGVLGESPTSQRGMPERNKSIKDTSYEEIEDEIREMIRSGQLGKVS